MSLLLDTHVLLWWLADDDSLTTEVKDVIDTEASVYFSAVTVWEICIKQALGKLDPPGDLLEVLGRSGVAELPVRSTHAVEAGRLPMHHRDPFDRMLVAQARCEGLTLMTRDPQVRRYDVQWQPV